MSEMERNPEVPTSTRDEALFSPAVMCEKFQGAPRHATEDLNSLRRHERVPQVDMQLKMYPKLYATGPRNKPNSPLHV